MQVDTGAVSYRYQRGANAQMLALQIEAALSLRLAARFEGDATEGYLEARKAEVVITCFRPLAEAQRAALDEVVAAHVYLPPEQAFLLEQQAYRPQLEALEGLDQAAAQLAPPTAAEAASLPERVRAWDGKDTEALRDLLAQTVALLASLCQTAKRGLI